MRFSLSIALPRDSDDPVPAKALSRYGSCAEELGFHALYLVDHLLSPRVTQHSGAALGVLAQATERVKLGWCAYVLPLRHPIAAARELATLDALCEGRLIPAVAAGSSEPEFRAFGIRFKERGRILDEGLEAMVSLWTQPSVDF